jgi:hypothetical protein
VADQSRDWTLYGPACDGLGFPISGWAWRCVDGRELTYVDVLRWLGAGWITRLFELGAVPDQRVEEAYDLVAGFKANPATWYSASTATPNTDVFVADAAADSGVSNARLEGWEADLQALIEQGDLEIDTGGPMR